MKIQKTLEYQSIAEYYGDLRTAKSNVRLMNHIDQGIVILEALGACMDTKRAYCLHPLFQASQDFNASLHSSAIFEWSPRAIALTVEYRHVANSYLLKHYKGKDDALPKIYCHQVKDMLIADKVQNKKDFVKYHIVTHPESEKLQGYFKNWLNYLDVETLLYLKLADMLELTTNSKAK